MAKQYFALMELEQIAMTVRQARESGLLDDLIQNAYTAEQIAERYDGAARSYTFFLNTLVALGYLVHVNDRYEASQELRDLARDKSFNWGYIAQFLKTGKPWIEIDRSIEDLDVFYSSFFSDLKYATQMAQVAEAVARRLEGRPGKILDIGTGTGLWSLAMASLIPEARVTGVDLPQVLRTHFLQRAKERQCADRVDVIAGDFHEVRFDEECYDRAVMGSSFHFLRVNASTKYLEGLFRAITPGGEFVVIDHFADTTGHQRLSRTLYEMRLAMRTLHAKNYSRKEIIKICTEVGFVLADSFEVEGPGFLSVLNFNKPTSALAV